MYGINKVFVFTLFLMFLPWQVFAAQDSTDLDSRKNLVAPGNTSQSELSTEKKFAVKFSPIGLPWPAQVGFERKISNVTVGASFGYLPTYKLESGIKATSTNINLIVNYQPWNNGFYTGLGAGRYQFYGYENQSLSGNNFKFEANVDAIYIYPHVGWRLRWPTNWFLGFELGLVVPATTSSQLKDNAPFITTQTAYYQQEKQRLEDEVNKYSHQVIPQITFFNIGYEF